MSDQLLEKYGTKLMVPKPSSIWAAAMADLERKRHNKQADVSSMRPYAFHRKHVAKAESANDLIRAALKEPGLGCASSKKSTRALYADVDLLKSALR